MKPIKKYLFAGLFVWVPILVTFGVLGWSLGIIDRVFYTLVEILEKIGYQPLINLLNNIKSIPFISLFVLVAILLATGLFATNFIGQWWLRLWNSLLGRIPIVKSIYSTVKQVSDTLFSDNGNMFKRAVWVPYPHAGVYTIAFVTLESYFEPTLNQEIITVFLPTAPTPTAGFLLMYPAHQVKDLNMSIDVALKYVVSLGVVTPPSSK